MNRTARFWSKVRQSEGCWEWQGARSTRGYGMLVTTTSGRRVYEGAHRVSWEIHYEAVPDGMLVCHRCDNPICVRPDHLFLGTSADNNADRDRKGRYVRAHRGEATPGVRLTEDDVRNIRRRRAAGEKLTDLAREYDVRKQTISAAATRRTWAWLD